MVASGWAPRSAELESLGIVLRIERPAEGVAEQETYSLPPENYYLPAVAFTDDELAALQTALSLLDGEFAYAEPLRLALQQLSWGRPSPLRAPDQRGVALGLTGSAGGHELSLRLSKIETAIHRRKTITFDYYTMQRDELGARKVDPYQLLYQGGQFYLVGHSHERKAIRVFRLSRIRGKVAYATKAEHDFHRPESDAFDPRAYSNRIEWQLGDPVATAEVWISNRIAWQVERHFGRYGEFDGELFRTEYATARLLSPGCSRWARTRAWSGPPSSSRSSPSASNCSSSATRASPSSSPPRLRNPRPKRRRRTPTVTFAARRPSARSASHVWSRSPRSSSRRGARSAASLRPRCSTACR